ncbi:hypothetical protein SAMN05443575_2946 [Jatrophihabitans endophyticus]|uniref:DUF1772 domain-containing protein n=1 Tax=Jatrophihabitans endophyticus TaxID=1206085 RepID=A0A1M5N8R3_9ACTN|nr:hypothetical protein [Jatrophihabitans endophyticus]SHG85865.1 hypothetical protein SAMN05443575_2946 [Jatrophihabitans endophyticus]
MPITAVLLLVATSLYAGFQWTIRVVVYPQFTAVPREAFHAYEAAHQRRVTVAVGPLFLFAGGAAVAAFVAGPGWATGVAAVCVAGIVLVTGLAAVPQHRRLGDGFVPAAHARLLAVDTARLVLALLAVAAAAVHATSG